MTGTIVAKHKRQAEERMPKFLNFAMLCLAAHPRIQL